MHSRDLSYNVSLLAIDDKRKEMRYDTLWYWCICNLPLDIDLPFISPMLDYSIDGRVCKAG
jgi:hypothetical protein